MSHISKCAEVFNDEDCMRKAAMACGLEFSEANDFRFYAGNRESCVYKMTVPGNADAYECGFEQVEDGTFRLKFDPYRGGLGLMEHLSAEDDESKRIAGRFIAEYRYERTKKSLNARGIRYREERVVVEGRKKRRLVAAMRGR